LEDSVENFRIFRGSESKKIEKFMKNRGKNNDNEIKNTTIRVLKNMSTDNKMLVYRKFHISN